MNPNLFDNIPWWDDEAFEKAVGITREEALADDEAAEIAAARWDAMTPEERGYLPTTDLF